MIEKGDIYVYAGRIDSYSYKLIYVIDDRMFTLTEHKYSITKYNLKDRKITKYLVSKEFIKEYLFHARLTDLGNYLAEMRILEHELELKTNT